MIARMGMRAIFHVSRVQNGRVQSVSVVKISPLDGIKF